MAKELMIDLGGEYPSKNSAVQRHAFELGWRWPTEEDVLIHIAATEITLLPGYKLTHSSGLTPGPDTKVISAERFLEMNKADIISVISFLKSEPELVETTRYQAIIGAGAEERDYVSSKLYATAKEAIYVINSVGYKEIKVKMKKDKLN